MKTIICLFNLVLVSNFAHSETRDQVREKQIEQSPTFANKSEDYIKEQNSISADGKLKTMELGAWANEKPSTDSTIYQMVLKVSCSDGEGDLFPAIPRNRPVEWIFKNDKITIQSGSAHVDKDGYVRFLVNNTKTHKVKNISVILNSEEKIVDVISGPFDLVYKRKTCSKKQADKK